MTGHRRRGTSGLEPLRGVSPQQPCDNRRSMGSDPGQFRRRLPAPPIPLYHGSQETSSAPDQGDSETGTGKDEKDGEGRGRRQGRRWKNEKEWRRDEKATKGRGGRRRDGQKREGDERTREDGGGTGKGRGCALVLAPRMPSHVSHVDSILWSENRTSLRASPLVGSVRCRRMQKRCSAGASIDAGECKHMQASMQANASIRKHRCSTGAGTMQANASIDASIDAEECKHAQASMQERCSTGAGAMQHGCRSDAARVLHGCRNDAGAMLHRCRRGECRLCIDAMRA